MSAATPFLGRGTPPSTAPRHPGDSELTTFHGSPMSQAMLTPRRVVLGGAYVGQRLSRCHVSYQHDEQCPKTPSPPSSILFVHGVGNCYEWRQHALFAPFSSNKNTGCKALRNNPMILTNAGPRAIHRNDCDPGMPCLQSSPLGRAYAPHPHNTTHSRAVPAWFFWGDNQPVTLTSATCRTGTNMGGSLSAPRAPKTSASC